jgi:uncharacterized cupredoxin-like copper-binding protein
MRKITAALAIVVFSLSACGGDNDEEEQATGPALKTITLTATDFKFDPATVQLDQAGTYTFKLVNNGQSEHALEIEGGGLESETDEIGPGDSAEVTVDLSEPGDYEFYCPVDGHKDMGMEGTLTVAG